MALQTYLSYKQNVIVFLSFVIFIFIVIWREQNSKHSIIALWIFADLIMVILKLLQVYMVHLIIATVFHPKYLGKKYFALPNCIVCLYLFFWLSLSSYDCKVYYTLTFATHKLSQCACTAVVVFFFFYYWKMSTRLLYVFCVIKLRIFSSSLELLVM